MASLAKTIVATGGTSGLGFEAIKQLLLQSQPYRIILGARNLKTTQAAFDAVQYDRSANDLSLLPLDLADLTGVRTFAQQTLEKLGQDKLDYVLLNAGMAHNHNQAGKHGLKWNEVYVVNHLSQHYLLHLLRPKLESSKSRIVVVSSGGVRNVPDPSVLDKDLQTGSGVSDGSLYCESKFVQLLAAHWWRRQLKGTCDVVAVSPGLIPQTGLGRNSSVKMTMDMPDAKTNEEGGTNILRALWRDDLPEDPDRIFLTSWGEWWESSVIEKTLDKKLQDKWSPSQAEIEKEAGLA